ncbi:MAG: nucleoside hydrolase [Pseudomonadota bacterium]
MRPKRFFLSVLATLGLLVGSASDTGAHAQSGAQTDNPQREDPWIIDTDMGREDWLALLLALGHPSADILAISVVGDGVGRCPAGAQTARAIVALASDDDDIPVACGADYPMDGYHAMPADWRDATDISAFPALPPVPAEEAPGDAVDLIIATLQSADRPVSILTIGPLTNVALALDQAPDIAPHIREIVMMAGAVYAAGNVAQPGSTDFPAGSTAEWNAFIDPVATAMVLSSGVSIRLVPLDATNHVPVTDRLSSALLDGIDTPQSRFAREVVASVLEAGGFSFWDPLAASVALDRAVCDYQMVPLLANDATADQGWSYPGTTADFPPDNWQGVPRRHLEANASGAIEIDPDHGSWILVCSRPNVTAFTESFRRSLAGG